MLDTTTRKRIDDCRDILVGKLPDPKAQIEQITIALIYKFMDDMDKEAVELGGAVKFFSGTFEKYSWDNLFDAKVTATEMLTLYSDAIASMDKNPNIPQLFRDIFKNAFLPYRDPETLKLFLKTIGEFEYTHSEKLGDAFEYLLSVMGSQGDAGQFRTPRHIIDFLVAVVAPKKTDTILDPACGTAGFLISAFKHIMGGAMVTPDERRRIIGNLTGYDISPDMVRLSLVNLYLHGFSDPHIWEYDTLSSEDRWNETYDVILANPPFMSPKGGIRPHKKFSISSNRSEVLFVDYIAEHLNPKGRAGIIVPEGVIFQSGTAYKDLRKMLVDNYLYAVVSLPAGVFNPYSGVKTSILLMDRAFAKTTDDILFVKIENDGYGLGAQRNAVKGGQLEEGINIIRSFVETHELDASTIAHLVPKSEIAKNGDYNLSGERYRFIETSLSSYPIVALGDYINVDNGRVLTEFHENGAVACIKVGDMNLPENENEIVTSTHWINETSYSLLQVNSVIFPKRGAAIATNKKRITKIPCLIDNNCMGITVIDESKLNPRYLFAFMKQFDLTSISNSAGIALINNPDIRGVKIPLPPLSVQEEIVAEIEQYQKIIDGAKMVVANYKPKIDIDPDWEMVELGKVGKVCMCKRIFKEQTTCEGDVPFYKIGTFGKETDAYISNELFHDYVSKFSYPKRGDVLISTSGTIGKTIVFDGKPAYFQDSNIVWINNDETMVLNRFLFVYYQMIKWKPAEGVTIARLYNKIIEETKIPIPPLKIQLQIVTQIEKEQELVNANKELIVLFEQKIKDRIAKVWGSPASQPASEDNMTAVKTQAMSLSVGQSRNMAAEPDVDYKKE